MPGMCSQMIKTSAVNVRGQQVDLPHPDRICAAADGSVVDTATSQEEKWV